MRTRSSVLFIGFAATMALAYFALPNSPTTKLLLYNGVGLCSVIAIIVGVMRNRPEPRRPWLLFAAGQASFLTADVIYYILEATTDAPPFPSIADVFYLGMYPLVIAGLVSLIRQVAPMRDYASLIDAGIIAVATFAVSWIFIMDNLVTTDDLGALAKTVSLGYPVMDIALLATAARLAVAVHWRHPSFLMMATALASLVLADTAYALQTASGTFSTGSWVDAFWLTFYVGFGAAALHPATARPLETGMRSVGQIGGLRLVALCLATVAVPIIDLIWGQPVDEVVTTFASATLFLFVLGRVVGLMRAVEVSKEQARHESLHDSLTGLANRILFADRVEHALSQRSEGQLAVLFIDLDDFKTVNDSLGHQSGDELLSIVSQRLLECVREGDTVARLGGDEFAILLESASDGQDAVQVAERVLELVEEPIALTEREVRIRASVGIAVENRGKAEAEALLRGADVAMYMAKAKGKGRYEFFVQSMYDIVVDRLELKADLEMALLRDEFEIHYQPIVDIESTQVTSVEALIRWQHPIRGIVPPTKFVPLAEETGLIVPIGRWVLEQACRQTRQWQVSAESEQLGVSVNLSVRQLNDPNLTLHVQEALRTSGLRPSCLTLEITESMLLEDRERSIEVIEALKALDVKVAIDDFGTGYSSLGYLRQFPVDTIKIDRSFIQELHESSTSGALVRTVIDMARALSVSTVAEGIEDLEQLQALADLDCELGQGFVFARPGLPSAMEDLVVRQLNSAELLSKAIADASEYEIVRGLDAIAGYADDLNELHLAAEVPIPARWPWLSTWAKIHADHEPVAVLARIRGRAGIQGAALLAKRSDDGVSQVVPMGHGPLACTRFPVRDAAVASSLAAGIREVLADSDSWTLLASQVPKDDPVMEALVEGLEHAHVLPDLRVPRVDLDPEQTSQSYLSKGMRRQLRKAQNRITTDGLEADICFERNVHAIPALLNEIETLHVARDHALDRDSDLDDPVERRFWREVLECHNRLGQLEVATMRLDGELAAYVVALVDGVSYRVFDGRMNGKFAFYSPGRVLETAALEKALARGFAELDWMSGVGEDKILTVNVGHRRVRVTATSETVETCPSCEAAQEAADTEIVQVS
ncbi:MAG: GNAT family N-acetyltransferase [Actinomycetota bacterium]